MNIYMQKKKERKCIEELHSSKISLLCSDKSFKLDIIYNFPLKNFINKQGGEYEILIADNGEQALEKYGAEKPDLVFMDIKMPEI